MHQLTCCYLRKILVFLGQSPLPIFQRCLRLPHRSGSALGTNSSASLFSSLGNSALLPWEFCTWPGLLHPFATRTVLEIWQNYDRTMTACQKHFSWGKPPFLIQRNPWKRTDSDEKTSYVYDRKIATTTQLFFTVLCLGRGEIKWSTALLLFLQ